MECEKHPVVIDAGVLREEGEEGQYAAGDTCHSEKDEVEYPQRVSPSDGTCQGHRHDH